MARYIKRAIMNIVPSHISHFITIQMTKDTHLDNNKDILSCINFRTGRQSLREVGDIDLTRGAHFIYFTIYAHAQ